jgi:hypothetical protein
VMSGLPPDQIHCVASTGWPPSTKVPAFYPRLRHRASSHTRRSTEDPLRPASP